MKKSKFFYALFIGCIFTYVVSAHSAAVNGLRGPENGECDNPEVYPFITRNELWGIVDRDGKFLVSPAYNPIWLLDCGYALFGSNLERKYGIMNTRGKVILPGIYDAILTDIREGVIFATIDGKTGIFDLKGRMVHRFEFDVVFPAGPPDAGDPGIHLARIGNKSGYIRPDGRRLVPFRFDDAGMMIDGTAPVAINGKWGLVDGRGRMVIPTVFNRGINRFGNGWTPPWFSEGLGRIMLEEGGWGFIDRNGRIVLRNIEFASDLKDGLIAVLKNGKWGYIDKAGKSVIPPSFVSAGDFYMGRAIVKTTSGTGVIDGKGNFVVPPTYDRYHGSFELGPVAFREKGVKERWVYIDRTGNAITGFQFSFASNFVRGFAIARNADGLMGVINENGRTVIPFKYHDIKTFQSERGLFLVRIGKQACIAAIGDLLFCDR